MTAPKYDSTNDTLSHIHQVRRFIALCRNDLLERAIAHDQTKLHSPEKEILDEHTPALRAQTFGSEEYERGRAAMGIALEHHYAHNRHHPEFHQEGILDMSLLDILEMLCDWKAATLRHEDGDIRKSIETLQKRFGYSDELKRILLNTLPLLETAI